MPSHYQVIASYAVIGNICRAALVGMEAPLTGSVSAHRFSERLRCHSRDSPRVLLDARALAIVFFYALGTAAGGVGAPWPIGTLVGTGSHTTVFGYLAAAALLLMAARVKALIG